MNLIAIMSLSTNGYSATIGIIPNNDADIVREIYRQVVERDIPGKCHFLGLYSGQRFEKW